MPKLSISQRVGSVESVSPVKLQVTSAVQLFRQLLQLLQQLAGRQISMCRRQLPDLQQ